jgi:hypothetical protein
MSSKRRSLSERGRHPPSCRDNAQTLHMREQGMGFPAIARELGIGYGRSYAEWKPYPSFIANVSDGRDTAG